VSIKTGPDSRNWRGSSARSVSPDSHGGEVGRRGGGRRGRGRGRWAGVNAGPRFSGVYHPGFGKLIFQHISCVKSLREIMLIPFCCYAFQGFQID